MAPRLAVVLLISLVAVLSVPLCGAGKNPALRLVATTGDREFADFAIEKGELRLRSVDSSTQTEERGIQWRLEGELRDSAELCFYSPTYEIVTKVAYPFAAAKPTATFATTWLRRGWPWSDGELANGLLVFLWLVDGQPVRVEARTPDLRLGPSESFAAVVSHEIADQSRRGAPAVMLWKAGVFIPPAPWFSDTATQKALAEIYIGSPPEVAGALDVLPRLNPRCRGSDWPWLHLAMRDDGSPAPSGFSRWREWMLLDFAANDGRGAVIDDLLARGVKPNGRDGNGATPLHLAAANGRVEIVRRLVKAGAPGAALDSARRSPFQVALDRGHLDVACELLSTRPKGQLLQTAMQMAVTRADAESIIRLLEHGGRRYLRGLPADAVANLLAAGKPDLVSQLIEQGMKVNAAPLLLAAAFGGELEVIDAMLKAGAAPDQIARDGSTALMVAAWRGNEKVVQRLLQAGADPTRKNARGASAAMLGWMMGHTKEVDLATWCHPAMPLDASRIAEVRSHVGPPESFFALPAPPVADASVLPVSPVVVQGGSPVAATLLQFTKHRVLQPFHPPPDRNGVREPVQYVDRGERLMSMALDSPTNFWAVVTMLVEPSGRPSFIQVVDAVSQDAADATREAVADYQYLPGEIDGRPVRARVTLVLTAEP